MKSFSSAARLWVLALCISGSLAGCKKADAPVFSPVPGTYTATQYVTMTSPTLGAVIVYTTDGSAPSCIKEHGTIYSAPVAVTADTTLRAMACALLRSESDIISGTWLIRPPASAPVFDPPPGAYTSEQHVTLTSATPGATFHYTTDGSDPSMQRGTDLRWADRHQQLADPQSGRLLVNGFSDSAITSGGYDITLPPEQSGAAWHRLR